MEKKLLIIFCLFFVQCSLWGQYIDPLKTKTRDSIAVERKKKQKEQKKKKDSPWFKGGNFSMQFAPLGLDISPSLFYRVSPKLQVGAGISYIYNRLELGDSVQHLNIYGGRLQVQPRLSQYFFLQAEYEFLNVDNRQTVDVTKDRVWLHNPQLGAGIVYPLGNRLSLNLSVVYDFNYNQENSPFPSPWRFRFGFSL